VQVGQCDHGAGDNDDEHSSHHTKNKASLSTACCCVSCQQSLVSNTLIFNLYGLFHLSLLK
jgi:hypothetical protein